MTYPIINRSTLRTVHLGIPGSMVKTVCPNAGVTFPLTRAGVTHILTTGGTAVTRRKHTKRTYTLTWDNQTPDEADPILSFYLGTQGFGPFCLIDPSWRNYLTVAVSTFGRQLQAIEGWSLPAADTAPTYSATIAPPPLAPYSGVLVWPAPVNTHTLFEGTQPSGV